MLKSFSAALLACYGLLATGQAFAAGPFVQRNFSNNSPASPAVPKATAPVAVAPRARAAQPARPPVAQAAPAATASQPTQSYSYFPHGQGNYGYAPVYSGRAWPGNGYPWPGYPTNQYNAGIARAYSPAAGLRPGQIFGTFGLRPADARVRGAY